MKPFWELPSVHCCPIFSSIKRKGNKKMRKGENQRIVGRFLGRKAEEKQKLEKEKRNLSYFGFCSFSHFEFYGSHGGIHCFAVLSI